MTKTHKIKQGHTDKTATKLQTKFRQPVPTTFTVASNMLRQSRRNINNEMYTSRRVE